MLSAVVERLLKPLREARPETVRQFFALASQHMRWELNHLAHRLAPVNKQLRSCASQIESISAVAFSV
jgi:hypothetical protein